MKKIDNSVANNVCENVFFTKSSNYAKNIPVHGVNSLQPEPARYLGCERRAAGAGGQTGCWAAGAGEVGRCPCGRDVPVVRHVSSRDPVSNITLAVGVALLLCGLATTLLGVYGYLLKVRTSNVEGGVCGWGFVTSGALSAE